MKQIRLSVTPPSEETVPVHQAIQSANGVGEAALLSGGVDSSDPTELFSVKGKQESVLSTLDTQRGIRSVEFLSEEHGTTYVYVRESSQERTIADALTADTLVVTLPIRFRTDGVVELTVLGSGSDLQSAVKFIRNRANITVLAIQDGWTGHDLDALTERQRTVLRAAYDAGYYDYPRTATQKEVAATVNISGSTVAEHLRNAEHTLIEQAIDS